MWLQCCCCFICSPSHSQGWLGRFREGHLHGPRDHLTLTVSPYPVMCPQNRLYPLGQATPIQLAVKPKSHLSGSLGVCPWSIYLSQIPPLSLLPSIHKVSTLCQRSSDPRWWEQTTTDCSLEIMNLTNGLTFKLFCPVLSCRALRQMPCCALHRMIIKDFL